MTIFDWLANAIKELAAVGISTARLDAELLLNDVLEVDRAYLHSHQDITLERLTLYKINEMLQRRINHEPIAYIRGLQEFYGREFLVSPDTLTPRPETETMLDLFIQLVESKKSKVEGLNIIDIGTGSGCIIITSALELAKILDPKCKTSFLGLDISEKALKIAHKNAKKLKTEVEFRKFDLTKDSISSFLIPRSSLLILANLPYVPNDFHINLSATHEPEFAIFGGEDGLDYYRALFNQLSTLNFQLLTVFTESLPPQHNELEKIAEKAGFKITKTKDLIQIFEKIRSK